MAATEMGPACRPYLVSCLPLETHLPQHSHLMGEERGQAVVVVSEVIDGVVLLLLRT